MKIPGQKKLGPPQKLILESERWQMEGSYAWRYVRTEKGGKIQNPPGRKYRFTIRKYVILKDRKGNTLYITVNMDPVTEEYDVPLFHFSDDKYQSGPWKRENR
jgi:hypothetical protein